MELQWPLIIFTTLVTWSAGLFGTQALLATRGEAAKAQMTAWVVSAVLLGIGGVAVFFHLEHWERIFNGFGHITSGITQELIAIVMLALVAIAYLVAMRKSSDGSTVPAWLGWVSVIVSVVFVLVVAHSYLMATRPAWDTVLWVLYMLGNALAFGPLTMAVIMASVGDDLTPVAMPAIVGAAAAVVASVAFGSFLSMAGSSFVEIGYYFDPTQPSAGMVDASSMLANSIPLVWGGAVAVGAVVPMVCALLARRKGDPASWKIGGSIAVACVLVGAVCMRVAFYSAGLSVFMLY